MRDVRRDYGQGAPIEIDDPSKPLELLSKWVQDAIDAGVTEPNAMNIATVDERGNPRSRMVLLQHLEGDDIGFFTNLESDKSVEIQGHSMVSATIWWPEMEAGQDRGGSCRWTGGSLRTTTTRALGRAG